jgi:transposase InsO family protein
MESFFGHFKDDVDYKNCKTYEELKTLVDEYMNYYNNERYQWGIQKMTPVEYRNHLLLI